VKVRVSSRYSFSITEEPAARTFPTSAGTLGVVRCADRVFEQPIQERALEPRDVVQAAIDAYHDHDLDRCLSYYAPDVVVKDAHGNVVMDGSDAVRARYARSMAENPDIHYYIPNRISLGAFVVDEEHVTGFTKPGSPADLRAVLIYRFSGELIREITILT
jgi:hypothetical protein